MNSKHAIVTEPGIRTNEGRRPFTEPVDGVTRCPSLRLHPEPGKITVASQFYGILLWLTADAESGIRQN